MNEPGDLLCCHRHHFSRRAFFPSVLRHTEEDEPVGACISFHSEWMERGPHRDLVDEALVRRQQFPVAAVVVVHDDISLLRAALEAAAIVVEYIVSERL